MSLSKQIYNIYYNTIYYNQKSRNVLVSIEMLIMSVMGVINMSRQFFNTLVGMGSRSHDVDDEFKISF